MVHNFATKAGTFESRCAGDVETTAWRRGDQGNKSLPFHQSTRGWPMPSQGQGGDPQPGRVRGGKIANFASTADALKVSGSLGVLRFLRLLRWVHANALRVDPITVRGVRLCDQQRPRDRCAARMLVLEQVSLDVRDL